MENFQNMIVHYGTEFGIKILAAIAFWIVGRWLVGIAVNLIEKSLNKQFIDVTMVRYVKSITNVTLTVLLLIGILGYLGIQTTTFAALLAAAGVAIGMAWAGLLSNFAAGVFLIVLRPFKVGDQIVVSGITGVVKEIGLFATTLNTPDNILTLIGNNKIFSDNIQNHSTNAYRRVDLLCQLAGSADHVAAMKLLREKVAAIPNVMATPAVEVEILEFNLVGPMLVVRPYCNNVHYWQVYFDTNRTIRESLAAAGFPVPVATQLHLTPPEHS
ncbi:MAG: mechanosensitive ion channel family protein [Gallionella sp.]|nr:mechanosensitive ion channel family protein [Gallionella sp.]MDD4958746.1 mechanosensitive ion channel family protein [Gallionella sp.]